MTKPTLRRRIKRLKYRLITKRLQDRQIRKRAMDMLVAHARRGDPFMFGIEGVHVSVDDELRGQVHDDDPGFPRARLFMVEQPDGSLKIEGDLWQFFRRTPQSDVDQDYADGLMVRPFNHALYDSYPVTNVMPEGWDEWLVMTDDDRNLAAEHGRFRIIGVVVDDNTLHFARPDVETFEGYVEPQDDQPAIPRTHYDDVVDADEREMDEWAALDSKERGA